MTCSWGKYCFKFVFFRHVLYGNHGLPCQSLLLNTTILIDVLHQDSLYVYTKLPGQEGLTCTHYQAYKTTSVHYLHVEPVKFANTVANLP